MLNRARNFFYPSGTIKVPLPRSISMSLIARFFPDPPLSPRVTLPTMYDLPSEDPEEPGLPDEYHALQPQLLTRAFRSLRFSDDKIFIGSDLNLYYDSRHPQWYKRPDWFGVVGVSRLYEGKDLRSSYVIWQEGVNPFVVVELLSPGTEKEDLGIYAESELQSEVSSELEGATPALSNGQSEPPKEIPPRKWEVYEQILRVPYYVVFSRYTHRLHFFQLVGGHYQEQPLDSENPRIWISELELGLGIWEGTFEGVDRPWLRWVDTQGNWVLTDTEQARQETELALEQVGQERQRAEQERQLREELIAKLRARGIDPDAL